jgi:TolB-like protein/class 3 adenylate cyclase
MSAGRKLTTILAADVAGYSRLAGADEELTLARLRALRSDLIDPIISVHHGRIVKRTGDGALIEFRSVVDAVRCAIEVQDGMAERNAGVAPERKIEFRIGIHVGDVVEEADGDLMGDGVNIAARLEGICEPGGICLSNAAYEQVRDKIAAEFADLGEQSLKNIARPVRVYAVGPQKSPSPPHWGGEGRDEVGKSSDKPTSPSHAFGAGPSLSPRERAERGNPPRLSIVVLPFANIGGDPEQEYFVDGVTESLTTDLSRISGSFVIARNTAFTYKGKSIDVKQIGRELGVRYVLEGSVQRGGNRLRVNVQLIDAETGNHLWAERFDKPLADLFDMQDEIVARLANQLGPELIVAEARRIESLQPHELSSIDLAMRGWSLLQEYTIERGRQARPWFETALRQDEHNVSALLGLAECLVLPVLLSVSDNPDADLAEAEAAIAKALLIAPNTARLHYINGMLMSAKGAPAGELREQEIAIRLDRNLAIARVRAAAALLALGRTGEVAALVAEGMRLSPRDARLNVFYLPLGIADLLEGKLDAAVENLRRSVELNRHHFPAYFYLAAALALAGNGAEARAACEIGLKIQPNFTIARARIRGIGFALGVREQYDRLIDGMRKAGVPEG